MKSKFDKTCRQLIPEMKADPFDQAMKMVTKPYLMHSSVQQLAAKYGEERTLEALAMHFENQIENFMELVDEDPSILEDLILDN